MGFKNIGATISLKDGGFKSGIKSAVSSLGTFKKGSDSASSSVKKFGSQANSTGSSLASMGKKVAGAVAAYAGFNQVKNFVTDCVTGVMELERANTRLETLMMNVEGTTKAQVQELIGYADALELVTTIEGDATTSGISQLATFQLQSSTIKTLMPAFQDLAVAQYGVNVTQEQMIQSGNLIGKVMNGSVGALTKAGVSFTEQQEKILKTGTEAEKAATLVEVLNKNFGGLAQQMAQTDEGKIVQLKNAWGSVKDEIGMAVMPAVSGAVNFLAQNIPRIRDTVSSAMSYVSSGLSTLKTVGSEVWGAMKTGLDIVTNNWNLLSPIIYGVAGAIGAYKLAVAGCTAVEKISLAVSKAKKAIMIAEGPVMAAYTAAHWALSAGYGPLTAAQWAFNAAVSANPVGVAVVAIGALIAVGVALWKNWDSVSKFFVNCWSGIKTAFTAGVNWIKTNIKSIVLFIINPFAGVFNYLYTNFEGFRTFIDGIVISVKTSFQNLWNGIVSVFSGVASWFGGIFSSAWNMVVNAFSGVVGFFQGIWNTIKNMFTSIGTSIANGISGAFKSVINSVISFAGNLINGFINSINWAIGVINKIPGVNITKLQTVNLPMLANGGNITRPGDVIVGERGPEMLHLPKGASVEPLDRKTGGNTINLTLNIDGTGKDLKSLGRDIVNTIVPELKLALSVL